MVYQMTVPGGIEEAHSPDLRSLQPARWTPEASIQQPPSRASQARWRWASGCEVRSSSPRPKRSVLDRKFDMPYDTVGQDVGLLPDGYRRVDPTAGFLQGVLELRRGVFSFGRPFVREGDSLVDHEGLSFVRLEQACWRVLQNARYVSEYQAERRSLQMALGGRRRWGERPRPFLPASAGCQRRRFLHTISKKRSWTWSKRSLSEGDAYP